MGWYTGVRGGGMKSTEVAWRLVVGCAGRLAGVVVGSCGGVNWWAGGLVGLLPRPDATQPWSERKGKAPESDDEITCHRDEWGPPNGLGQKDRNTSTTSLSSNPL